MDGCNIKIQQSSLSHIDIMHAYMSAENLVGNDFHANEHSIAITTTSKEYPLDLIEKLNVKTSNFSINVTESAGFTFATLTTKYYTTKALLRINSQSHTSCSDINIIYLDKTIPISIDILENFMLPIVKDGVSKILLLKNGFVIDEIYHWCIKNDIQVIYLENNQDDDEYNGYLELANAIVTYDWLHILNEAQSDNLAIKNYHKEATQEEDFDKLYKELLSLKKQATTLAPNDRKKFAEEVAIKFWKSIGGDEDEILDL